MNIFDKVSSSSQTAEQGGSTPVSELAGNAVGPLLSKILQDPAKPLFPELSQAFGGLFDAIQPGQQSSSQAMSSPFSPAAAGIPSGLFNNPSQLLDLLGNASQKLSNALGSTDLRDVDNLEQEANQASQKGAASEEPQDQLAAQQALLKMQVTVEQASTLMNIRGQNPKGAIDNR